jgi:hypothetical protein
MNPHLVCGGAEHTARVAWPAASSSSSARKRSILEPARFASQRSHLGNVKQHTPTTDSRMVATAC